MVASGQDRIERRLAAIFAADVAGYSRLTAADEEGTHVQLQDHLRALVDPKIVEHRGRVVKNTGDGLLAEFGSVVDALRCALDVQHGMAKRNAEVPDEKRLAFRIGINVGDIIVDREDIFGDSVNVAARLEGLAEPGGICISEDAHRQICGKFDVTFEDAGERQLKNIARLVRVFRAVLDAESSKPISQPHNTALAVRRANRSAFATVTGAAVVLVAVASGAAFHVYFDRAPAVSLKPDQAAKPSERFSIVVLPFANLSGDVSQDYLADVISDELTTGFSRFRDSFVISRSTAFTYKGRPMNLRQIGKDLGVRYALEGAVQPSSDRLRVSVQLIDTESDAHIWTDQFDENRSDLLQMQDAIVTRIAHAIGMKMIAERARLAQSRAANPTAEDLALRCSAALMRGHTALERDSAYRLCEQALQIDPENLRATSQESFKFTQRVANYTSPDRQADLRRADELASLAIKIDPNYAQAHTAKGDVLLLEGHYREAIGSYQHALTLLPSSIQPGLAMAYNYAGEPEQAIAYADKAMLLSPRDPVSRWPTLFLAKVNAFGILENYEEALVWIGRGEAAAPEMPLWDFMRSALLSLTGKDDDARAAMQRYLADDKAPFRTMSQRRAQLAPLSSYSPRFRSWGRKFSQALLAAGMPE
ncbi:MAG: adenylate/guanylate cyclase domain-containing protein [Bradyrhizobium sp.]|uniref:adenylate/guanylate cyclase domain-containing protein n=1 Tax=Bradyrhizobium sp. TaxID=376 RepID=UPI001D1F1828|nr:adenylate/guanylate cyclase domain-containing protein [Bradyrhizobium sp.]MBV9562086.1 adenylate/guanylate cyclase domain-containing protein [Bradyrhizobium sp.]